MTRNAIADELYPLLNGEPQNKSDVVHVFVQIRKILEHDGKPTAYGTLNFFCDWLVHAKLTRSGAREILKLLDERLPTFYRKPEEWDPDGAVLDLLSFQLLRQDLMEFFVANDLPTRWSEDMFTWNAMLQLYGQQVQATPLVIEDDRHSLNYIRRVEIVSCEPSRAIVEANPTQKFFGFNWTITLNSGRTFSWPHTSNLPDKPENYRPEGVRADKPKMSEWT